jgi:hypothetical protein
MGSSFVTSDGEHGFWMTDGVLDLWLRLLALHLPEPTDRDPQTLRQVTREIRNQWLLASKGFFAGCVPVGLDQALSTSDGKDVVVAGIRSLRKALSGAPPKISKDALNLLGFEGFVWVEDFETRRLIEVADAFLELVDGTIKDTARSTNRMPGCR